MRLMLHPLPDWFGKIICDAMDGEGIEPEPHVALVGRLRILDISSPTIRAKFAEQDRYSLAIEPPHSLSTVKDLNFDDLELPGWLAENIADVLCPGKPAYQYQQHGKCSVSVRTWTLGDDHGLTVASFNGESRGWIHNAPIIWRSDELVAEVLRDA